jgi:hypothetical protein
MRNSLFSQNPSHSKRPETPHGRRSICRRDIVSVRHFYALLRECSAKPVRCSTPTIALDSLASTPRQGYRLQVRFLPRFLARSDVQMQTFFATSASISLTLAITDPRAPCSKKIVLELWSLSVTSTQISPHLRHRYMTLID